MRLRSVPKPLVAGAVGGVVVAAAFGVAWVTGASHGTSSRYTPGDAAAGQVRTLVRSSASGFGMGPLLQLPDGSILAVQTLHVPDLGDDNPGPLDRSLVLLKPNGRQTTIPAATLDSTKTGPEVDPITADTDGNAYLVDRYHNRIVERRANGQWLAITKTQDSGFALSGDGGKAIDATVGDVTAATTGPDGSLYLTGYPDDPPKGQSEVRRIGPNGGISRVGSLPTHRNGSHTYGVSPSGLTWAHGHLYAMALNRIGVLRQGRFHRVASLHSPSGGLATLRNGDVITSTGSGLVRLKAGKLRDVGPPLGYTLCGQDLKASKTNDVMIFPNNDLTGRHTVLQAYGLPARS